MRKILIVNTVPFLLDGISSVIMNYYENIDLSEFAMDFVANCEIALSIKDRIEKNDSYVYVLERNRNPLKYMLEIVKIIKNGKYDVMHIHGNSGTMFVEVLAGKIAKIKKTIVHCHNTKTEHPMINAVLKRPMIWMADSLLACSVMAGNYLYGKHKYTVLKNAINVNDFKYNEQIRKKIREEFNIGDNYVIGHVGNFTEQKNHLFLIDVFAMYQKINNNAILLLVGDGSLRNAMKEKINKLGLDSKVIMTGSRTDVNDLYQMMDMFLLPSLWEGLPLVLLEAQVAGMPVLVSDNVSREAKCTDMYYALSLKDNADKWANMIEKISGLEYDRNNECVYDRVDNLGFNIKYVCKSIEEIYND